jgi:large subunit ribosomal protein L6
VEAKGDTLVFSLGYSNPVEFPLPQGITAQVEKATRLELKGADKEQLGQTAANIRSIRPPDVYKGKGVRYAGEKLRKKVGKAGGR